MEVKQTPQEAYQHIQQIIESCNAILSSLLAADTIARTCDVFQTFLLVCGN